jgi:septal ring factor EnvC (AmiA/AmiB activator)
MYDVNDLTASALLEADRRSLEVTARLEKQLEQVKEDYASEMARVIADRSRERTEWARERQHLVRRAEGLADDLARTQASLTARDATIEHLSARRARVEGAASELLRQVREGSDREVYAASLTLERELRR